MSCWPNGKAPDYGALFTFLQQLFDRIVAFFSQAPFIDRHNMVFKNSRTVLHTLFVNDNNLDDSIQFCCI